MKLAAAVLAAALGMTPAVYAADKHGGHEVEVGKYPVALVVKDRDVSVYVRDQADKPVDPKTVKASANVLSGKDRAAVRLALGAGGVPPPGLVLRGADGGQRTTLPASAEA